MLLPSKNQKLFFHIFMQTKCQMHISLYIRWRADASCLCLLHYDSSCSTLPNSHSHSEHLPCSHVSEKQPLQPDAMSDCQMTFGNIAKRKTRRGRNKERRSAWIMFGEAEVAPLNPFYICSGFTFLLIFYWIWEQRYGMNLNNETLLSNFYWIPLNLNIVNFPTAG